ncbi:MAG: twin-arginine translocase TatA/TatE family subunit [Terriglobales bacterium]
MGGFGGFSGEMIFLFFLALILFGPKKLPEIGRQVGRLMNEFRRASNEFRAQIESEINAVQSDVKPQILPPLKEPLGSIASRIFNPPSGAELEAAETEIETKAAAAQTEPSPETKSIVETEPAPSLAATGTDAALEAHPVTKAAPDA